MKPPVFDYRAVDSVEAALAALSDAAGDGKIIAGGQSLVPMMNFRMVQPAVLVDINRIAELSNLEERPGYLRIGALTRHRILECSPVVARHFPVLSRAMEHVAHLAIRNRGTIGGSLSHADPAAELPMMALLLDARLTVASPEGEREVEAADFFLGSLTADLGETDLLTAIDLPLLPAGTGWDFQEVARRSGDFALAALATTLTVADGVITEARIAMMGIGETAVRAGEAEALLTGRTLDNALVGEAVAVIRDGVEPNSDLHASGDYRRHLIGILAERALGNAWARAQGDQA